MESFSTDDELESSSSVESESLSNEYSLEEELINSYLPLQSSTNPVKSNDDLVKSRLEELYPLVQKLNCHDHHKEKKKQSLPTLISAITGEPYSPLTAEKPLETDEKLEKKLRDMFVGPENKKGSNFMKNLPELLPIASLNLDCDPNWEKKEKKKEKKDKRFTMSDMMPHFADRMATEMLFQDSVQNSTIKSLMIEGQLPLGCLTNDGPCDGRSILAHIRQFHGEFYHLLYTQNLLDAIEARKDLAVIIPSPALLATLDVTSESTRKTLLYHLVIIPNHNFIQNVEGMYQYETLSGDYIQVESDNGKHYVNGVSVAKPDVNCIYHIYHVSQILSPFSIVSITEPEGTAESEPEPEAEGEAEPEEPARGTETAFISTILNTVTTTLTKSNTSLGFLAEKMNSQFYTTSHEMKDHIVESSTGTKEAKIHLNIYNTSDIYSDYQLDRMRDISRIKPETVLGLSFSGDLLTHLDMGDLKMTEYGCCTEQAKVKKSDLARGLVGLSFQLNETPGFVVLMCKMFPQEGNCFVSEDGNLLMRFSGERLDSIALNQNALSTQSTVISTSPLGEHHFFEYKMTPELYKVGINRAEFDSLLLTNGKIKRWFKKKTQQATDKAKCGYKRLQSIDLKPIPAGYLKKFVDQINLKTLGANSQGSFVTLNAFDKSCHVLSSKSVLAKRFNISTEKGDKVILYEFNSSDSVGGDYHMLEIQMDASPKLTLHTHTINRKGNDYFTARRNSNVYLFTFDPLNGGLRALYITLAKSHLGQKILDYSRVL